MNVVDNVLEMPFSVLRVPNTRLKAPKIGMPNAMTVFGVFFLSYFLVISGIIYDVIVEPPSIGSHQDETGAVKPVAFLQYRVNGQFIIEGLSAGAMFVIGAFGIIFLDFADKSKTLEPRNRYVLILIGLLCCVVAYNVSITFLKMKIPGYLVSSS